MAFLAAAANKSALILQRSFLALQMTSLNREKQFYDDKITEKQKALQKLGVQDYESDQEYMELEQVDERLEIEVEYINEQKEMLDQSISSLDNLLKKGIQDSCKLNLS